MAFLTFHEPQINRESMDCFSPEGTVAAEAAIPADVTCAVGTPSRDVNAVGDEALIKGTSDPAAGIEPRDYPAIQENEHEQRDLAPLLLVHGFSCGPDVSTEDHNDTLSSPSASVPVAWHLNDEEFDGEGARQSRSKSRVTGSVESSCDGQRNSWLTEASADTKETRQGDAGDCVPQGPGVCVSRQAGQHGEVVSDGTALFADGATSRSNENTESTTQAFLSRGSCKDVNFRARDNPNALRSANSPKGERCRARTSEIMQDSERSDGVEVEKTLHPTDESPPAVPSVAIGQTTSPRPHHFEPSSENNRRAT